jgi:hypothetical protein
MYNKIPIALTLFILFYTIDPMQLQVNAQSDIPILTINLGATNSDSQNPIVQEIL